MNVKRKFCYIFLSLVFILVLLLAFLGMYHTNDIVLAQNCAQTLAVKEKPTIEHAYQDNSLTVVYDGLWHRIFATCSSGSEVVAKTFSDGFYYTVQENAFKEVGVYNVFLTAAETSAYYSPDPLAFTVKIKPCSLICSNKSGDSTLTISSSLGFNNGAILEKGKLSLSEKNGLRSYKKDHYSFLEKVTNYFKIVIDNDEIGREGFVVDILNINVNKSTFKNAICILEKKSDGEIVSHSFSSSNSMLEIENVMSDSTFCVIEKKENPYLWIWLLAFYVAAITTFILCWFFIPRKVNFFIDGAKVDSKKVKFNKKLAIDGALLKYVWYMNPLMIVEYNKEFKIQIGMNLYTSSKNKVK